MSDRLSLLSGLRSGASTTLHHLIMNGKFAVCIGFASCAAVRRSEVVVPGRIGRLKLHADFERGDGFGVLLLGDERGPETEIRSGEGGIQFRRLCEMLDCLVIGIRLPSKFTEHILGARVSGINLQLFVKLLFRFFSVVRRRVRDGEEQSADPKMNAGHIRIFFEDGAVFLLRVLPFALDLQCLGV